MPVEGGTWLRLATFILCLFFASWGGLLLGRPVAKDGYLPGGDLGTISTLNCAGAVHVGTLTVGAAAGGVSSTVSYTGGNGASHNGQVAASTGVLGLTATLQEGTFANGAGTLVYTITGTPSRTGTASFALNIGGVACILKRVVTRPIASLNCSAATHSGTLTAGSTVAGASSVVSYTGGNGSAHNGQVVASTGVTGLTATLTAGSFANGAGTLTYTIQGTPVRAGTASFALSIGGLGCTLNRVVAPPASSISALNCAAAVHSGEVFVNRSAGASSLLSYTGGNGGAYAAQSIPSTGVTGLTATLAAGNFANGSGTLSFNITGTASRTGMAVFMVNIGGVGCTFQREVKELCSLGDISGVSVQSYPVVRLGALVTSRAAANVSIEVPYINNTGKEIVHCGDSLVAASPFLLSEPTLNGLTFVLRPGKIGPGSGVLIYEVRGTPTGTGLGHFWLFGRVGKRVFVEIGSSIGSLNTINCAAARHAGTLKAGEEASGVFSKIPYTGNAGAHGGQRVASTGVTGLVATLSAGNFLSSGDSLTYTITGVPSGAGTASFQLDIGGKSCVLTRTVTGTVGTVATLSCSGLSHLGTLIQGVSASGVSISIPYSGGNGGGYGAVALPSSGVTGLTATLNAGNFANGSGSLVFTVTGTPARTGSAIFYVNIAGRRCIVQRQVLTPIAGLNCSGAQHSGSLIAGGSPQTVSSTVPYSGGNGTSYDSLTIPSTGVTGLVATLPRGTFANGSGNLAFSIRGTPSGPGNANFALSVGGRGCVLTRVVGTSGKAIAGLDCAGAVHRGTLTVNVAANGVSTALPYSGGNGEYYSDMSIASTGVTGLTAFLVAGSFGYGSDSLRFYITGTPSRAGTAVFSVNIGGQSCTLTRIVQLPEGAIGTLSCNARTVSGIGFVYAYQTADGVSVSVPYTGGNGGTYGLQSVASSGVTGLTARLSPGILASGSGTLNFAISGTPTGGLSTPSQGSLAGSAIFPILVGGKSCSLSVSVYLPVGTVSDLNCAGATHNGRLTVGQSALGVSSSIPYTGGNGGTYTAQSISSTGVTGLTATISAGTLQPGSGSLAFTITGIPNATGTATFALNIGGRSCSFSRPVLLPIGTVVSLGCSNAAPSGSLQVGVPADQVSTGIPYTGGNGGTYDALTLSSSGVTGLTASLAAGVLAGSYAIQNGTGNLVFNITGTPSSAGTANFSFVIDGKSCTFSHIVRFPEGTLPPVPRLDAFSPVSSATGGMITLTGANFTGVTAVRFGGVPASSYTVVDQNTIRAVVGNGASGTVSVHALGGSAYRRGFFYEAGCATRPLDLRFDDVDGDVNAIALDDKKVYIGGSFRYVGPYEPYGASLQATDGLPDTSFVNPDGPNGYVNVAVPDGSGGWFIGGNFTSVGGKSRGYVARINADGSLHPWGDGITPANGQVYAMFRSGQVLYIGGDFSFMGGRSRSRIAALDVSTGIATNWNPGSSARVTALCEANGVVYAGFSNGVNPTQVGGQQRVLLAAIDAMSGQATAWAPVILGNQYSKIRAIAVSGGDVFVGGNSIYTDIGNEQRRYLMRFNAATGASTGFDADFTCKVWGWSGGKFDWIDRPGGADIYSLLVRGDKLYIGGNFCGMSGARATDAAYRYNLACVNIATGSVEPLNLKADSYVSTLAMSGDTLYVGGAFRNIGTNGSDFRLNPVRTYLAAIDTRTNLLTDWDPSPSREIYTLSANASRVYAGGDFQRIGGRHRSLIAAFDLSTGRLSKWNDSYWGIRFTTGSSVFALEVAGGKVYVGGSILTSNSEGVTQPDRSYIMAMDTSSGVVQADFESYGIDNWVYALVANGNTLFAGGNFNNAGGFVRRSIAALDLNTGLAKSSWNPAPTFTSGSGIRSLALGSGTLYAGGYQMSALWGGLTRRGIAEVSATSGGVTSWNPDLNDLGGGGTVYAILADPGNNLVFVGGGFTNTGKNLSALNTQTGQALWGATSLDAFPYALWKSGNGTLYAGGNFRSVNSSTRYGLAALNPANGQVLSWNPNPTSVSAISGTINALKGNSHALFVGGKFDGIAGFRKHNFAVFGDCPPVVNPAAATPPLKKELGVTMIEGGGAGDYLHVYPNPAKGQVTVRIGFQSPEALGMLRVMDLFGREIGRYERIQSSEFSVDVKTFKAGIYIFALFDGNGRQLTAQRIVVQ